jgi:hypothetical protein
MSADSGRPALTKQAWKEQGIEFQHVERSERLSTSPSNQALHASGDPASQQLSDAFHPQ